MDYPAGLIPAVDIRRIRDHGRFAVPGPAPASKLFRAFFFGALWRVGELTFSSWSLPNASFIFSGIRGIGVRDGKGSTRRAGQVLPAALFLVVGPTVVAGYRKDPRILPKEREFQRAVPKETIDGALFSL